MTCHGRHLQDLTPYGDDAHQRGTQLSHSYKSSPTDHHSKLIEGRQSAF